MVNCPSLSVPEIMLKASETNLSVVKICSRGSTYSLALLLFILIFSLLRNLCDAQCSLKPVGTNGCVQNGKRYNVSAVWKTNNCQRCECKPKELVCCSLVFRPVNYDKKNCIAMFHRQTCSIRVVKKTDPTEGCQVFAGVG